jgi:hypothetical protein
LDILEIFGFSDFHRSKLDKRLAIGRILGNWEGLLVNWKIQNPNLIRNIGLWKIDGFEKGGRRTIPTPT